MAQNRLHLSPDRDTIVLQTEWLMFDFYSEKLNAHSAEYLEQIAAFLLEQKQYAFTFVNIEYANPAYSVHQTKKRCEAVAKQLESSGIDKARIQLEYKTVVMDQQENLPNERKIVLIKKR